MDNSAQRDIMLMRYMDGEMTGVEKEDFENSLAADASLREELESLQIARSAVISFGLKERVAGIHVQMMTEMKQPASSKAIVPGKRIMRKIVAVAASVIFIFLVYQAVLFYQLSPQKIYEENYISYKPDNIRDTGNVTNLVEQAYLESNYQKVIDFAYSSEKIRDNFLAAHAQLLSDNPAAAVTGFKKVVTLNKAATLPEMNDAAEYNLILAYILNKDYDLALELMNQVKSNQNHLYHDRMTGKLFRKVKMLKWR